MERDLLLRSLDYTLLRPTATRYDIGEFCAETLCCGFRTVFVNPHYIRFAHELLKDHAVTVGAPVGFSLGGATTRIKVAETQDAIRDGAGEIDMLINLGALKSGEFDLVRSDIAEVVKAARGLTTKVIIETALLSTEEKLAAAELVIEGGAHYVKTSTGFNGGGATLADIKLLKSAVGDRCLIKAAGGIRSYEDAVAMLEAGASRLGTSNAVQIMEGRRATGSY